MPLKRFRISLFQVEAIVLAVLLVGASTAQLISLLN